jgi:hypothetical protein
MVLFYNHAPMGLPLQACNVTVSIIGLTELPANSTIRRIDEDHANVYQFWVRFLKSS